MKRCSSLVQYQIQILIDMLISTAHRGMQVSQLLEICNEYLSMKRIETDDFTDNINV